MSHPEANKERSMWGAGGLCLPVPLPHPARGRKPTPNRQTTRIQPAPSGPPTQPLLRPSVPTPHWPSPPRPRPGGLCFRRPLRQGAWDSPSSPACCGSEGFADGFQSAFFLHSAGRVTAPVSHRAPSRWSPWGDGDPQRESDPPKVTSRPLRCSPVASAHHLPGSQPQGPWDAALGNGGNT